MKKYVVHLTQSDQDELTEFVKQQKGTALQVRRAQILLAANADSPCLTDKQISEAFRCRVRVVEQTRKNFCERGLQVTLKGLPRVKRPPFLDGEQEAKIVALRLSSPPKGRNGWTLRLLAEKAVELQICERISYQTVKKILKKQK